MNTKALLVVAAVAVGVTCGFAQEAQQMKIGIYYNPIREQPEANGNGQEGIKMALDDNGFENVSYINTLDPEKLKDYKVVIISCVMGYPREWDLKTVRENQRKYVENGGGLILCQESIGWRHKNLFMDNPPFPEIGRGVMCDGKANNGPVQITPMEVADKSHPIAKGLPDKVPYAYDMAPLKAGEKGKVVLKLPEKAIVRSVLITLDKDLAGVIAGDFGKGRVVLVGPLIGMTRTPREMETPPKGAELQLLINAVAWAGTGK